MIIHADNDVTDLSCHKRQKSPGTEMQEWLPWQNAMHINSFSKNLVQMKVIPTLGSGKQKSDNLPNDTLGQ